MRPTRFRSPGAAGGLSLLLFLGCATATPGTEASTTFSIVTGTGETMEIRRGADIRVNQQVDVTRDEAWAVLPRVYAELGLAPDVRDNAAMQLGVAAHRFSGRIVNRYPSDFFDCGLDSGLNRPLADQAPVVAKVVTQVLVSGTGTELRTVVEGTARRTGGNAGTATCRSTGLMEAVIGQMVQREAAPGS